MLNKCRDRNMNFWVSVPLCYIFFCVFAWLARVSFTPSGLAIPRVVPCRVYLREFSRQHERTFQPQQPMDPCSWRVQQLALMAQLSLHTGVNVNAAGCGQREAAGLTAVVTVYRAWRRKAAKPRI